MHNRFNKRNWKKRDCHSNIHRSFQLSLHQVVVPLRIKSERRRNVPPNPCLILLYHPRHDDVPWRDGNPYRRMSRKHRRKQMMTRMMMKKRRKPKKKKKKKLFNYHLHRNVNVSYIPMRERLLRWYQP